MLMLCTQFWMHLAIARITRLIRIICKYVSLGRTEMVIWEERNKYACQILKRTDASYFLSLQRHTQNHFGLSWER